MYITLHMFPRPWKHKYSVYICVPKILDADVYTCVFKVLETSVYSYFSNGRPEADYDGAVWVGGTPLRGNNIKSFCVRCLTPAES